MAYSDIVTPQEMADAAQWLDDVMAALRHPPAPAPEAHVECLRQSWGELVCGQSVIRQPICLNGQRYATGIGTAAESAIRITLPRPGRQLTGLAGIDDHEYARQFAPPLVFAVEAGGQELWNSGPQAVDALPASFDIDLAGRTQFTLTVNRPPMATAPADWAEMRVTLDDGATIVLGQPPQQGPCFSFTYDGVPSSQFLHHWSVSEEPGATLEGIATQRIVHSDPNTGLQAIVDLKQYTHFPVVEWLVRFRNTGSQDTPIVQDVQSMDILLPTAMTGANAVLNYHTGDYRAIDGYEPHRLALAPGTARSFAPDGGRPTNRAWPYYNIECPATLRGAVVVVGWPGQWASNFRSDDAGVHIAAGQELTHLRLQPGEEVRTPLSVLMFWRGDRVRSHNLWRRWMMAHNMPRPGGRLPQPFMPASTSAWFDEMSQATESDQTQFIDRYVEENIQLDYWWMDAGWYPCDGTWNRTGTWEVDAERFPRGLRAVSDHARASDIKTLVWFEPERVAPGTWLYAQRQQWLLGTKPVQPEDTPQTDRPWWDDDVPENKLLDLGNDEALQWVIDRTDQMIHEQGIDLYRQDFNFDPLDYWRANDAPDRQGIAEIRYVEGYLSFWRALRERFPDMLIDSCASGGRRNDLETMRLSVPLHKTDYNYADLPTKQAFHHSLFMWLPFFGAPVMPVNQIDPYTFRSAYAPMTALGCDMRLPDLDYDMLRRLTAEWREVAPYYAGDYFPLLPYDRTDDAWIAWQFHRPAEGDGIVQAFRRSNSPFTSAHFKLYGLDGDGTYRLADFDALDHASDVPGRELIEHGLRVELPNAPQAIIFRYQRSDAATS